MAPTLTPALERIVLRRPVTGSAGNRGRLLADGKKT